MEKAVFRLVNLFSRVSVDMMKTIEIIVLIMKRISEQKTLEL